MVERYFLKNGAKILDIMDIRKRKSALVLNYKNITLKIV